MTASALEKNPGDHWTVHCDGSAKPNPGPMGLGAVLTAPDGSRYTLSRAAGARGCNNEAELRALAAALQEARRHGVTALSVYSDNSVLVEQLCDARARPIARLAGWVDEARALLASFDRATLRWIPRHRNAEADLLSRAALGLGPKPAAKPSRKRR